ncbi:MAG: ice-binding family protein [Rhodoglobus sp.]
MASARSLSVHTSGVALATLVAAAVLLAAATPASAAVVPAVGLGAAASFSVLGGSAVTNTGPSTLNGDLGVWPSGSLPGFGPATLNGATHQTDAVALQAQSDVTTAATTLMSLPSYNVGTADLDGLTFLAGAYSSPSSLLYGGTITLEGDADDVFIFTSVSSLTTASSSTVAFIGDVQACNVFWRIGSTATLGTNSNFVGTLIAQTSVVAQTSATIAGRLFAQTAEVTLDSNVFSWPACDSSGGDGKTGGTDVGLTSAGPMPTVTAGSTRTAPVPGAAVAGTDDTPVTAVAATGGTKLAANALAATGHAATGLAATGTAPLGALLGGVLLVALGAIAVVRRRLVANRG